MQIEWTNDWVSCDQDRGLLKRIWEGQAQVTEIPGLDTASQADYEYWIDLQARDMFTKVAEEEDE